MGAAQCARGRESGAAPLGKEPAGGFARETGEVRGAADAVPHLDGDEEKRRVAVVGAAPPCGALRRARDEAQRGGAKTRSKGEL